MHHFWIPCEGDDSKAQWRAVEDEVWCRPLSAGTWSGLDHDCVAGKVEERLQGSLVAVVCLRSTQTVLKRQMSDRIWYLFLLTTTGAVIAVVSRWKPHLPHPLTLAPGLRLSWSLLHGTQFHPVLSWPCTPACSFLQMASLRGQLK